MYQEKLKIFICNQGGGFKRKQIIFYQKGDELPIQVEETGGSGPAKVWGHVKIFWLSAEEKLMASVSNEP